MLDEFPGLKVDIRDAVVALCQLLLHALSHVRVRG
jgi:hypothetical protein